MILVTHDVEEAIYLADTALVMRPGPGHVASEIKIDLPEPRDRASLAFVTLRQRILADMETFSPSATPPPARLRRAS